MGSSIRIVIGPYIEVKGTKEIKSVKTILSCSNKTCYNHNKNFSDKIKFCGECGTQISSYSIDKIENATPRDILFESDLELNCDDLLSSEYLESIFIPNIGTPDEITFDSCERNVIDLNTEDINDKKLEQIKWMEETYKEEINLFIENFGKNSVFVKWGIISYWT